MIFTSEIFFTFLCNVVERKRERFFFDYHATDASLHRISSWPQNYIYINFLEIIIAFE